ncbi:GHKL domain-containing protein [Listeria monocytogenes]|uniref:sensor histidine kinase n=1 Tax=Listeria monocytogenes TaxID=1639 RepID=UPI0010E4E3A3|nr:GHKL domain-containing protein [Listeria monocytogenes]EAD7632606.1 GHKL domain-containing protein [Listeria monocytogenes]
MGVLEYYFSNLLHYVFLQDILIFLVIYILGNIKSKKSYFISSLVISLVCSFLYSEINLMATGLVWLLAIFLVFRCTNKMNIVILLPSLSILLYILISYLVGNVLSFLFNVNEISVELTIIVGSIVYILFAILIKYIYIYISKRVNISEKLIWSGTILAIVTFISYFIIIAIERFNGEESAMGRVNAFFIIGYGVTSAIVFLVLMYSFQKEYITKEKQKELHYLKEYTDQLEKNYTEMRRFRHDYQNILMSIEDFIKEENLTGLEDYFYTKIKKASQVMEHNNFKLSQLSNITASEVKSLVASKLTVSQELGVNTEIEVNEPIEEIKADSIMLIRSLGIILDNAIEAASAIENGFVRVAFFKNDGKTVIVTANSCVADIPKLFELKREGFSTKGTNRGTGLSNLDLMVSKENNAMLETKIENGVFSQVLSIGG